MSKISFICSKNERKSIIDGAVIDLEYCSVEIVKNKNSNISLNRGIYKATKNQTVILECYTKEKCKLISSTGFETNIKCNLHNIIESFANINDNNSYIECDF